MKYSQIYVALEGAEHFIGVVESLKNDESVYMTRNASATINIVMYFASPS